MNNDNGNAPLSPSQIAAWYREQASKYLARAEELERDFGLKSSSSHRGSLVEHVTYPRLDIKPIMSVAVPSPERVKQVMDGRKLRAKHIAAMLNVPVENLMMVLTEANGFFTGDRGWIGVKEDHQ